MKTNKHMSLTAEVLTGSIGISESLKSIQEKINEISASALDVEKSFESTIGDIKNFEETMNVLSQTVNEQGGMAKEILSSLSDIKDSCTNVKESALVLNFRYRFLLKEKNYFLEN